MIAVQGPNALRLLQPLTNCDIAAMRYYTGTYGQVDGLNCFVSRTGYTGEDGCEIIVSAGSALNAWRQHQSRPAKVGVEPVGLGARDTLRLEAAMPLYGHELSRSRSIRFRPG